MVYFSKQIETAEQARILADWHMNHADWAWGNRHDQIAFHLFKLANRLA